MIPSFDDETGYLPAGVYPASWQEVVSKFAFSQSRRRLLGGLLAGCRQFRKAGADVMYLDGSFTTSKRDPGDYDCCYDRVGINVDVLDPVLLQFEHDKRTPMRDAYLGEFFPSDAPIETLTYIGTVLTYFQQYQHRPRGIVALDLATLP